MEKEACNMLYLNQEYKMSVQYVIDEQGHKTGVFLTLDEYEAMLNLIEQSEDEKAYDTAMKANEWISLEDVEKKLGL